MSKYSPETMIRNLRNLSIALDTEPLSKLRKGVCDMAADTIQELQERNTKLEALSSQWVSVDDDEKPELHESVWIYTTDCDGVPIASVAHWNGHLGFLVTGGYKDPDVTHWKRIVPPIEQEQEK
jgi:hypothetical protein